MNLKELLGNSYKEGMSFEEIEKALETVELPKDDTELLKYKNLLNKANSEASNYKKRLEEKMTEEEQLEEERKAYLQKLEEENQNYKREMTIAKHKADLLGLGYSEELANETAKALFENDIATFIKNQSIFIEEQKKQAVAEAVKGIEKPVTGNPDSSLNKKNLRDLTGDERYALYQKNPEVYMQIFEGE